MEIITMIERTNGMIGQHISDARAARLKQLGIKTNGEIIDDKFDGIAHARAVAGRNKVSEKDEGKLSASPVGYPESCRSKEISDEEKQALALINDEIPLGNANNEVLHKDIEELSTENLNHREEGQPIISTGNNRLHSLLPAHCDEDIASIYSDKLEEPPPGYEIRPPERDRRHNSDHQLAAKPSSRYQPRTRSDENVRSRPTNRAKSTASDRGYSNLHAAAPEDAHEQLHGTVVLAPDIPVRDDAVGLQHDGETTRDAKSEIKSKPPKPVKSGLSFATTFSRLKSYF